MSFPRAMILRGPYHSEARDVAREIWRYILFFVAGALIATGLTAWLFLS